MSRRVEEQMSRRVCVWRERERERERERGGKSERDTDR